MDTRRQALSPVEVAEVLGISRSFAYEAIKRGDIRSVTLGKRVLVPWTAIEEFLGEGAGKKEAEAKEVA